MKISDIPAAKVLLQPMRLDVLRHLKSQGGQSSLAETRRAIGEPCRQSISEHCAILEQAGLIERRRYFLGNTNALDLVLTDRARYALAMLAMEVAT
jgi:hypothetical protein